MTIKVLKWYNVAEANKALQEFNPDVSIDLYRQPGLYAWWNSLLVQAEAQYDRLLNLQEVAEATVDRDVRNEANKAGVKITESQVKSQVATNPKIQQLKGAIVEAKAEVGYLKGVCIGLKQRLDALLQISRNMAVEMRDTTVAGHIREDRNDRTKKLLSGFKPIEFMSEE